MERDLKYEPYNTRSWFNHYAPCILYIGQTCRYSPQYTFYIFSQQIYLIIFLKISLTIFVYSPPQNVVYLLMLPFLVHKIFTFYINGVLNCKLLISSSVRFTPGNNSDTHWIWGWVGPTAGTDVSVIVQILVQTVHRLLRLPLQREAILKRGKAIPLQAWTGSEGSAILRLPYFKIISTRMW